MEPDRIYTQIAEDRDNAWAHERGWLPVYTAHPNARILVVGQAPGIRAQTSGIPWNDRSGDALRTWMNVERETFYDPQKIALVPMDFYFPGSKDRGDLPPRKGFAEKWHPLIRAQMPHIRLVLTIGQYAHAYYLGKRRKATLTETVRAFDSYLPEFLPLVHPSPRNIMWHKRNPWFMEDVVPRLRSEVEKALN